MAQELRVKVVITVMTLTTTLRFAVTALPRPVSHSSEHIRGYVRAKLDNLLQTSS